MTAITAYGIPLSPVTSFLYFGRVILASDDDWLAVVHNLRWAQQKWARLSRVLSREVAGARTLGIIYVAVVQVVLLYGLDMWVLTPRIGRLLGGFHQRVYLSLVGRQHWRWKEGGWVYLLMSESMAEVEL